jgi:hypothetical protein
MMRIRWIRQQRPHRNLHRRFESWSSWSFANGCGQGFRAGRAMVSRTVGISYSRRPMRNRFTRYATSHLRVESWDAGGAFLATNAVKIRSVNSSHLCCLIARAHNAHASQMSVSGQFRSISRNPEFVVGNASTTAWWPQKRHKAQLAVLYVILTSFSLRFVARER